MAAGQERETKLPADEPSAAKIAAPRLIQLGISYRYVDARVCSCMNASLYLRSFKVATLGIRDGDGDVF